MSKEGEMGQDNANGVPESEARRDFLKKTGRFAAVTPPAITLLLGTSLNSKAIAKSGGTHPGGGPKPGGGTRPGHGWGDKNHGHSGPPGRNKPKNPPSPPKKDPSGHRK